MYLQSFSFFQTCIKDDILPNGIPIYAGEHVSWNSWGMGRDETIWGDDAKQFIPERWLKNDFKPSQFEFIGFHAGPRKWYVLYIINIMFFTFKLNIFIY